MTTPVIGVFDTEKDLAKAIKTLEDFDLDEGAIKLVGEEGSFEEYDIAVPIAIPKTHTPPTAAQPSLPVNPVATTNATPEASRSELEVLLPNHGVPQAEAPFLAEAVSNGARLLIVDAEGDTADKVRQALRDANATRVD